MRGYYSSIFQKEFFKTRLALVCCVLAVVAVSGWSVVLLAGSCRAGGAVGVVAEYVLRGSGGWGLGGVVSLLVGVGLSLAQFVPEAVDGRIRLTLHLPVAEWEIVLLMCAYGWLSLAVLALVGFVVYVVGYGHYVPMAMVLDNMLPVLPWCCAGFAGYNLCCAACLDRAVRARVKWVLCWLALVLVVVYLPGDVLTCCPFVVALSLPTVLAPFLSSARYKAGRFA